MQWSTSACVCLCVLCIAVCCPGLNSAIPALLTLSYRADWVRVLGSKAICSSTAQPLLPSHLLLSSLRVICRLHTYTAYLSGSLSMDLRAHVWAYACVAVGEGDRTQTYRILSVFRWHAFSLCSKNIHLEMHASRKCICHRLTSAECSNKTVRLCIPLCTADSNHPN